MPTTIRRTITAVLAACLLLAGAATTAAAAPRGHDEQPHVEGLFYGNFDEQVLLFARATTQDFCNGNEPTAPARVFHRRDGIGLVVAVVFGS